MARDHVASLLSAFDGGGVVDTARLLVSELVTNVLHTANPVVTVTTVLREDRVRIAVSDDSPA
ncbi:ATP-binding protein, partial [Streptomyces alkaliphilus]|nr:ATP-binding protein [Streptomyces alkaliphilus]